MIGRTYQTFRITVSEIDFAADVLSARRIAKVLNFTERESCLATPDTLTLKASNCRLTEESLRNNGCLATCEVINFPQLILKVTLILLDNLI